VGTGAPRYGRGSKHLIALRVIHGPCTPTTRDEKDERLEYRAWQPRGAIEAVSLWRRQARVRLWPEELGVNYFDQLNAESLRRSLVRRVERLGNQVTLQPVRSQPDRQDIFIGVKQTGVHVAPGTCSIAGRRRAPGTLGQTRQVPGRPRQAQTPPHSIHCSPVIPLLDWTASLK